MIGPVSHFGSGKQGESAKGTSPSAALRTQREPLSSLGSHYPVEAPLPILVTRDTEGNATTAIISGGIVSASSGNFVADGRVHVGDAIEIKAGIVPREGDVGAAVGVLVAIIDEARPDTVLLMTSDGALQVFDGVNLAFFDEMTLVEYNPIDIMRGAPLTLTSAEIGRYSVFVGYQLSTGGVIYFNQEPIVIDVFE